MLLHTKLGSCERPGRGRNGAALYNIVFDKIVNTVIYCSLGLGMGGNYIYFAEFDSSGSESCQHNGKTVEESCVFFSLRNKTWVEKTSPFLLVL